MIEGLKEVQQGIRGLIKEVEKSANTNVIVGYTSAYAIYVHENTQQKWKGKPRKSGLGVYWGPAGAGPKFLEKPAREMSTKLGQIIAKGVKAGMKLEDAMLIAGLRLQRESQKRVPVEYGNLKASAFTRKERKGAG